METPIYHLRGVVKVRPGGSEDFEGPLDLILYLLSRNRMEIRDIRITLLLEQYLAWMRRRRELDLEVASEFVAMAARLLSIKTRVLLGGREEGCPELDELASSLEERRRDGARRDLQAVLPELEERFLAGRDFLPGPPESPDASSAFRYVHEPEDLLRAMGSILKRARNAMPPSLDAFAPLVGQEPWPVEEKEAEILNRLRPLGRMPLPDLLCGCGSRSEVVAAFLAVLELCRDGQITLEGDGPSAALVPVPDGERGA